jgi:hypothetical protein
MRSRWRSLGLLAGAAACLLAGVVFAKNGVLVMKDGRTLEGDIGERSDQYLITMRGVETTVAKEDVASVTYPEAFNKEFENRLSKLAKDDVEGRISLARWAFERRQYGKAREALDSALAIDPNSREAVDLQNTITSQLKLESSKSAGTDRTTPAPTPPTPPGVERRLLSAKDINAIRQGELQPGDARVAVRFDNNVDRRFAKYANMQFTQFNALKPVDKALMIMEKGDASMKADVKVLNDPASIAEYRTKIQPMILNGCAAAACHGGAKGGDFILYNPADNEATSYTNFYILNRYKKKLKDPLSTGVFGSDDRKMIDRGAGRKSILAQFALPADVADLDHPQVQGYTGAIKTMDDPRLVQVLDWMNKSLKQPEPDYGIKFDPPRASDVEKPTTRQAK